MYLPKSLYRAVSSPGLLMLLVIPLGEESGWGPQTGMLCLLWAGGALLCGSGKCFIV